mmetsp:Transcript_24248/g.37020  ORF Transcript_24248/g.37020 Transcript_24248/m.37020 type:complete len:287 (-) Transcript_24248:230-1090(-)
MMSTHQSPFGRSRHQQQRMSSPQFPTSDDNTATSYTSSKSSTISGGAERSSSCIGTSSKKPDVKIEDKLQKDITNRALSKKAQMENDAMVYLDGPQIYTCGQCRTHLTSHDDIISKSFHGRHGRAYLFDQCVNIVTGPPEDRILITGLHSVCDINCKRCNTLVGWTYARAYEPSQRYKEGKFIIEKIHLHLEESDYYDVDRPAGERADKWRKRSMSWGSERSLSVGSYGDAYSRSGSGSVAGSPPYSSSYRCPQSPPTGRRLRHDSSSNAPPLSPRSPSQIIYEYK